MSLFVLDNMQTVRRAVSSATVRGGGGGDRYGGRSVHLEHRARLRMHLLAPIYR